MFCEQVLPWINFVEENAKAKSVVHYAKKHNYTFEEAFEEMKFIVYI